MMGLARAFSLVGAGFLTPLGASAQESFIDFNPTQRYNSSQEIHDELTQLGITNPVAQFSKLSACGTQDDPNYCTTTYTLFLLSGEDGRWALVERGDTKNYYHIKYAGSYSEDHTFNHNTIWVNDNPSGNDTFCGNLSINFARSNDLLFVGVDDLTEEKILLTSRRLTNTEQTAGRGYGSIIIQQTDGTCEYDFPLTALITNPAIPEAHSTDNDRSPNLTHH